MLRKNRARELVDWVGSDALRLVSAGTGWPSHFQAKTASGSVAVAAYMGPIGHSQRGRGDVERRFQNPGQDKPIVPVDGETVLLLGLYESDGTRLVVGMEVEKRLGRSTRQSLFMPLHLLRSAGAWGWAEHFTDVGERVIAFAPRLLPIYVELCRLALSVPAGKIGQLLIASGAEDAEAGTDAIQRAIVSVGRLVRDAQFSRDVRDAYSGQCAMCGLDFTLVEGAHIYPVAAPGSEDKVWNGIALCRNHHAAFDSFYVHVDVNSRQIRLHPDLIEEGRRVPGCKAFVDSTFPALAAPRMRKSEPRREMFEKRYDFFKPKYAWA